MNFLARELSFTSTLDFRLLSNAFTERFLSTVAGSDFYLKLLLVTEADFNQENGL